VLFCDAKESTRILRCEGFFGEVRGDEESVELWLVDFWEGYREQGELVWGGTLR
jgi:hypothetical protein